MATTELMTQADLDAKSTALAVIGSAEQAQDAGFYLRVVRQSIRSIKASYLADRKPLTAKIKENTAEEKRRLKPFEIAEAQVDQALVAWRVADRLAVEAQRAAQLSQAREDEAVRRDATVASLKAEAKTATGMAKTILKAQATALERAPLTPQITAPMAETTTIEGVALVEYWSAEVTDLMQLVQAVAAGRAPLAALQADMRFLDAQAETLHDLLSYPGVSAKREFGQTARGL